MGLKDWLGKVSGPKGYGNTLGKPAREAGSALANVVFMSHGIKPNSGPTTIFDTAADMKAAGFTPRFQEITKLDLPSLTLEEQLLFRNLQEAMISVAYMVNSTAAKNYMRPDNFSEFNKGLVSSLLQSMVDCNLFGSTEAAKAVVMPYLSSGDAAKLRMFFDMEKPASSPLLELFIVKAADLCQAKSRYGFVRSGLTGFDVIAVPLVQETIFAIFGATQHYKW